MDSRVHRDTMILMETEQREIAAVEDAADRRDEQADNDAEWESEQFPDPPRPVGAEEDRLEKRRD
jgi:hypothetical protein